MNILSNNENESESDDYNINYKLLKDFLNPIIKEENKRQLLMCYKKHSLKIQNYSKSIKKNEKEKGILDYKFATDRAFKNRRKNRKNKRSSFSTNRQISKIKNKKKKVKFNISYQNKSDININININKEIENIKLVKPIKINKNIVNSFNLNSQRNKPYKKIEKINRLIKEDINEDKIKNKNKNSSMKKNNKNGNNKYNQESNRLSSEDRSSVKNLTSRSRIGFNKWYNYGKDWEEIKMMKYCKIRDELEEKKNAILLEEKNEATFRPKLNKKSIQIVNKNFPNDFFERLIKFEQKKKLNKRKINEKCTPRFRPNLNKSNSCILSKRNYQFKS